MRSTNPEADEKEQQIRLIAEYMCDTYLIVQSTACSHFEVKFTDFTSMFCIYLSLCILCVPTKEASARVTTAITTKSVQGLL